MKVYLQTLTPLHIGTGEKYDHIDYLVENGLFYRISEKDFEAFINSFPEQEKNNLITAFSTWIDKQVLALDKTQSDNALASYTNKKFNLRNFAQNNGRTQDLTTYLAKKECYTVFGSTSKQVQELAGIIGKDNYYIAGSSIKGAIRTGLLYHIFMDTALSYRRKLENTIFELTRIRKGKKELNAALHTAIELPLYCGYKKNNQVKYDSEYYDLMKFVQITDTRLPKSTANITPIQIWETIRINEARKKEEGQKPTYSVETPALSLPVEAWRKGLVWEFDININLKAMQQIYLHPDREKWIGFAEKVKDFLGIDFATLTDENLAAEQAKAEKSLLEHVAAFYKEVLSFEKDWFERLAERAKGEKYLKSYQTDWDNRKLLRLGFAAGFPAHTELIMMLSDKATKQQMVAIMKALGIGNNRNNKGEYNPNIADFPKSRLLAKNGDEDLYPLGWCQLLLNKNEAQEMEIDIPANVHQKHEKNYQKHTKGEIENTVKIVVVEKTPPKTKEEKIILSSEQAEEIEFEKIIDNQTIFKAKVIDAEKKKVRLLIKDREIEAQIGMGIYKMVALENGQIVKVICKSRAKGEIKQVSYVMPDLR